MSRLINNCEHSPFKGVVFSNILKSNLKIYMLEKAETENEFLDSKNAKNMRKVSVVLYHALRRLAFGDFL